MFNFITALRIHKYKNMNLNQIQQTIFKAIIKDNAKNRGKYEIQAVVCANINRLGW
jgi:hypothetical protein